MQQLRDGYIAETKEERDIIQHMERFFEENGRDESIMTSRETIFKVVQSLRFLKSSLELKNGKYEECGPRRHDGDLQQPPKPDTEEKECVADQNAVSVVCHCYVT